MISEYAQVRRAALTICAAAQIHGCDELKIELGENEHGDGSFGEWVIIAKQKKRKSLWRWLAFWKR